MITYRFCTHQAGSITSPARYFLCRDDDDALKLAERMMKGDARAKVWRGAELVGEVSALASLEPHASASIHR